MNVDPTHEFARHVLREVVATINIRGACREQQAVHCRIVTAAGALFTFVRHPQKHSNTIAHCADAKVIINS